MRIVSAQEMYAIEQRAMKSGLAQHTLIENAANAIAKVVRKRLTGVIGKNIIVLAGPGNNGEDALGAALVLAKWGANITIHSIRNDNRAEDLINSLNNSRQNLIKSSQKLLQFLDDIDRLDDKYLVLDGLFGTGFKDRPESKIYELTNKLNIMTSRKNTPLEVLAIDIPSGMNPDDGSGKLGILKADCTVSVGAVKKGLLTSNGLTNSGRIIVAPIGIPEEFFPKSLPEILDSSIISNMLQLRPSDSHKGTFGKASVVGGSPNYMGAPLMAARAAVRSGAGLVSLVTPADLGAQSAEYLPEAIHEPLPTTIGNRSFDQDSTKAFLDFDFNNPTLIGPGIGRDKNTIQFIHEIINSTGKGKPSSPSIKIVIDADGITCLASLDNWWNKNKDICVITPHPGEMATLCNITTETVQLNRLKLVQNKSSEWGVVVVLKGAFTAIGNPNGGISINPLAWPGLASAGTGDVLSGLITGLLAQGHEPYSASQVGVYVHGISSLLAADKLDAIDRGILATDVADQIPKTIKMLLDGDMNKYLEHQLTIVSEKDYLS